MKPGPKPIPTSLKKLNGNPGKRPFNEHEPQPAVLAPEPPDFLTESALEEWNRLIPELLDLGLVSVLSRATIAAYCQSYGRWKEAEAHLAEESYVLIGEKGGSYQNPWLAIANKAIEQMQKISAEFGMTPSSQSRVTTTKPQNTASPLTLFAQAKK
jgi:P27 family predicted phage terminase small subunit